MKITVKKAFRGLEEGWVYDFTILDEIKSVTIVGENGCGKSSILQALRGSIKEKNNTSLYKSDYGKLTDNITIEHNYEKIIFFDGVKDNGTDLMNGYDAVNFIGMGGFAAQKLSHGQGALMYISKFMQDNTKEFIANQVKFKNFINNLVFVHNVHVLIVSHNPFFIQQSYLAYSFKLRKLVDSGEYIEAFTGYSIVKKKVETKKEEEKDESI
jgi:energy-coupling factor transporter ATP-binding protein EcfA2